MSIKANIRSYLILICFTSIAVLLSAIVFPIKWAIWGPVFLVIVLGLIWGVIKPPSIIGADSDGEFVKFKIFGWNGITTSEKHPIQSVKCERVLHSFSRSGSRDFRYNFYQNGNKIGTLYAFTLYWKEESLEHFITLFGPDIFKS